MASCLDYLQTQCERIAPGAIKDIKFLTYGWGKKYLFVMCIPPVIEDRVKNDIIDSFENTLAQNAREFTNARGCRAGGYTTLPLEDMDEAELDYEFVDYADKEVTHENAKELAGIIKDSGADVVVAVGGGKAYDLVRTATFYVDFYRRPRVVLIPTQLASNASGTSSVVIYNDEGTEMVDIWAMKDYPDAIIVDSQLIADTPVRFLAAGIGDALSSLEGYYNLKFTGLLDEVDQVGVAHNQVCTDILLKYGAEACDAVRNHEVTPALENVISAITFMSGPFFGLAAGYVAHYIDEAFIENPGVHDSTMHGERVGYGALPQFMYVGEPGRIFKMVDFYQKIGLPCTLEDLGMTDISRDEVMRLLDKASNKLIANMSEMVLDLDKLCDDIMKTNAIVNVYLGREQTP